MKDRDEKQSPEEEKELIQEAQRHVITCMAVQGIIETDPKETIAIMVEVYGIRFGLACNAEFAQFLNSEIREAKKCIKREPNKYE